jgi:hypothetical protein
MFNAQLRADIETINESIEYAHLANGKLALERIKKILEGVQTQTTNSRYVAVLEEDYHVLNRLGGALEGCRAELAIVIEHLIMSKSQPVPQPKPAPVPPAG